MNQQHKRETVTAEQMTYCNLLTVNALVELLDERGIIPKRDLFERIKALQGTFKAAARLSELHQGKNGHD